MKKGLVVINFLKIRFKVLLERFGLNSGMIARRNSFFLSFKDFLGDVRPYMSKISEFDLEDNGVYVFRVGFVLNYGEGGSFSFRPYMGYPIDFNIPENRLDEDGNVFLDFYSDFVEELNTNFENKENLILVDKNKGYSYSNGLFFSIKKIG